MIQLMAVVYSGLLALLLVSSSVEAIAGPTRPSWAVRTWQSDDGLPNNIVTSMAQTPDGYLWLANPTRLARFDGIQFEEFPIRNLLGENNQRVITLASGRD